VAGISVAGAGITLAESGFEGSSVVGSEGIRVGKPVISSPLVLVQPIKAKIKSGNQHNG
jgi:hypothetical protein